MQSEQHLAMIRALKEKFIHLNSMGDTWNKEYKVLLVYIEECRKAGISILYTTGQREIGKVALSLISATVYYDREG